MQTPAQKFFTGASIEDLMQMFISAVDAKLFPPGAPPRPELINADGSTAIATSSGLPLISKPFQSTPIHIPNAGDGANARHSYKTELVLLRDPKVRTVKMLWWHGDDPRDTPHNHPWSFRSAILSGGYSEERFHVSNGVTHKETRTYEAGDINVVPSDVFHNVRDVQPGTVTLLDCGEASEGNAWGYLNVATGERIPNSQLTPANFLENFRALNPHLLPKS